MPEGQYFRAGVGAVIRRQDGCVLAFERADIPDSWQFVQGGLEKGEEPMDAVLREIMEETGIPSGSLVPSGVFPEPLVYELPPEARSAKTGRGQVQYWFLFDCTDSPAIALPTDGEFRAWKWMSFDELVAGVVAFRKPVYRKLASHVDWQSASVE